TLMSAFTYHYYSTATSSSSYFFFFNATATPEIYTLSLHGALPICLRRSRVCFPRQQHRGQPFFRGMQPRFDGLGRNAERIADFRSEEHTSELQSRFDLVCRLLLEKKKD